MSINPTPSSDLPPAILDAAREAPSHKSLAHLLASDPDLSLLVWTSSVGERAAEEAVRLRPDRAPELAAWLVARVALEAVGLDPDPFPPEHLRPVHSRARARAPEAERDGGAPGQGWGWRVSERKKPAPVISLRDHELQATVRDAVTALRHALTDFQNRTDWSIPPEAKDRLLRAAGPVLEAALRDRQERGRKDHLRRAKFSTSLVEIAQKAADVDEWAARSIVQLLTGPDPRNGQRNQHPSWYLTSRKWGDFSSETWRSHAAHWASLLTSIGDRPMSDERRQVLLRRLAKGPEPIPRPVWPSTPILSAPITAVQPDLWGNLPERARRHRQPQPQPNPEPGTPGDPPPVLPTPRPFVPCEVA